MGNEPSYSNFQLTICFSKYIWKGMSRLTFFLYNKHYRKNSLIFILLTSHFLKFISLLLMHYKDIWIQLIHKYGFSYIELSPVFNDTYHLIQFCMHYIIIYEKMTILYVNLEIKIGLTSTTIII